MKHSLAFLALILTGFIAFAQFPYSLTDISAQENFRLGVQAYQNGRMAESILLFERVLSSSPQDPLSLFWLGRAYYKNGLESTALERWQTAVHSGGQNLLAESFEEYVSSRRSIEPGIGQGGYIVSGEFSGMSGKETRFLRPSWIHPLSDGGVLVVSHGTGDIVLLDVNGVVRSRYLGGLGGFDRPFALAETPDGGFWVSEFQSNRLSLCAKDGTVKLRISGKTSRERLSGPQYIASDSDGFLYVVDYGNGRVVKYSPKGDFLLEFGKPTRAFPGFRSPTGIAVGKGKVYVADSVRKAVYAFDDSGNYLDTPVEGSLQGPEGIELVNNSNLLIADKTRIIVLDTDTLELRELYRSDRPDARIVSATMDSNGNILASDFDKSVVEILSDPAVVYGGYFVEIERIRSDAFPVVEADVYIRDRFGSPVVGLDQGNFYATEHVVSEREVKEGETEARVRTESMIPVKELSLEGRGSDTPGLTAAVLVERSPQAEKYRSEVRQAVESVVSGLGSDSETVLITAGKVPAKIAATKGATAGPFMARQALASAPDASWRFDTALRLAVSSISSDSRRSAIVYVTTGSVNEEEFESASLAELAAYLRNNGIRFYAVLVGDSQESSAVRYLVETAGGSVCRVWDSEGLGVIGNDLRSSPSGRYRLRFTSSADSGFGRKYLTVSVEAYLFKKSGRDELGYFAPIQ